jgi:hypothetical protein
MEPNWLSTFALLAWPAVALWLYRTLPIGRATIWTILGGYLLLPVGTGIKIAMIPAFEKGSIPTLAALVGCTLVLQRPPRIWTKFAIAETLVVIFVLSPLATSVLNGDPIRVADIVIPGVGLYDGVSASISQLLTLIPFLLARRVLRTPTSNEDVLRSLALAGLAYSLPMMFEVRMSPQLHTWVYGYFPHSFLQQIREGGYRPVVFLGHGLLVAFFTMTTVVASAVLWRTQTRIGRLSAGPVTVYLGGMLVICKSVGALIYGAFLVPLTRLASPRAQLRVALLLVSFALLYPTLRAADLVPAETILSLATSVSAERAQSLQTRFDQEKQMLDHASQRPFLGWGRWGRNRLQNPESGNDISVTDGLWILTLGQFGYVGFLAQFGLLALTVARAATALKSVSDPNQRAFLAALALIVAISMVDLLPNASISPWTWLVAGALLGRAEDAFSHVPKQVRRVTRTLLFSPSRHSSATTR